MEAQEDWGKRPVVDELKPVARRSQRGFLDALSREEQATLVALLRRVLAANDAARSAPEESEAA